MNLKFFCVFLILVLVTACSDIKVTKYQDISDLEMPPEMVIVEKPKVLIEDSEVIKKTGLGKSVSLAGLGKEPVIKIKKTFERSWAIVEQALKLNEIEITDKNRDEGVFYVLFDPDAKQAGSQITETITFFFFEDEYVEAAYKLTVVWRDSDTEVTVELIDQVSNDILDDGEDEFEDTIDAGTKLLKTLYKTIKDDLPLD
ncbi:MAG: outer membrane protein assembly factor BamC [Methylococcales bacterium]|nr:outer membrane protein assembly factor BamC [Methylococcales bacterium]